MEEKLFLKIVEENYRQHRNSDFYHLIEQEQIKKYLSSISCEEYEFFGGLSVNERKTVRVNEENDLAAVMITFKKKSEFTHSTILGSVLALGIERKKTGDIIIQNEKAYMIVKKEVASFITLHLSRAGNNEITVEMVDIGDIMVPLQERREETINVASMRFDSILAAGFHLSRNSATELIISKKVQVNYAVVDKPSFLIQENDIISMRGKGRIIIKSITGMTKKKRLNISVLIEQ